MAYKVSYILYRRLLAVSESLKFCGILCHLFLRKRIDGDEGNAENCTNSGQEAEAHLDAVNSLWRLLLVGLETER